MFLNLKFNSVQVVDKDDVNKEIFEDNYDDKETIVENNRERANNMEDVNEYVEEEELQRLDDEDAARQEEEDLDEEIFEEDNALPLDDWTEACDQMMTVNAILI